MKPLIYPIIEHQSFGIDEIATALECNEVKAKKFFEALEDFAKGKDNEKFLKYNGKHKLKAQNYVGIIQTPYGTLEILPKCFGEDTLQKDQKVSLSEEEKQKRRQKKQEQKNKLKEFFELDSFKEQLKDKKIQSFIPLDDTPHRESAQNFLIYCLSLLKKTPFEKSQISSVNTCNTPLLDVFMQMFCQEFLEVCKKGIRHDYVTIEDNRAYLKGKLLFKEQIRHNFVHKERFYTSSDEYSFDIAPNRLIKSTLEHIRSKATSHITLTLINQSLEIFEEIPSSRNIEGDFLSCKNSRHFSYYDNLLKWCKLFLKNKSFTAYCGKSEAYALLFPMEKLFEAYVSAMLTKNNPKQNIISQAKEKYLIEENLFQLRPDLWIKDKKIIADIKWKIPNLTFEEKKYGISQNDLYQMWAYVCKYEAKEVWLIYPLCNKTQKLQTRTEWIFKASKNLSFYQENEEKEIKIKILLAPLYFYPH